MDLKKFYINGQFVDPISYELFDIINPATEKSIGRVALGSPADVDSAVIAARAAFVKSSSLTKEDRLEILKTVRENYKKRSRSAFLKIEEKPTEAPKKNLLILFGSTPKYF